MSRRAHALRDGTRTAGGTARDRRGGTGGARERAEQPRGIAFAPSVARVVAGLPSLGITQGPSAGQGEGGPVDLSFHGMVAFVTMGFGGDPAGRMAFRGKSAAFGTVLRVLPNGRYESIADIAGYEQAVSPVGGARGTASRTE